MPHCFFIHPTEGELQLLPEDKTHHIVHVLKMQAGETVLLHDGQNRRASATLELIGKKRVSARLTSAWEPLHTEPELLVIVFQALPKTGDKVEQVLQHGTELGAAGFVFVASVNSARLEGGDRIQRKLARWEEMIRNAAEQSGRGVLPTIAYVASVAEAVALFSEETRVCLDQRADVPLSSVRDAAELALFVGPESGFTGDERAAIGAKSLSMGPRTLRTETAALAALAQLGAGR